MSIAVSWQGTVVSVQPRIRLTRSFDERHHSYLGYQLAVRGTVNNESREFVVAVGKAAHEKHSFHAGMTISGKSHPVADPRTEVAEFYKTSGLKVLGAPEAAPSAGPPYSGVPPALTVYRERGHRRLAARTYEAKCVSCLYAAKMPVELIVDQWNPRNKRYRVETFCYGPKSCSLYAAGPTRKVPGRKGMSYEEEDWVDEDATSHRGDDE